MITPSTKVSAMSAIRYLTIITVCLLTVEGLAAGKDSTISYRVLRSELECVFKHKARYLSSSGMSVVIRLDDCESGKTTSASNSVTSERPNLRINQAESSVDKVIYLLRSEFVCLLGKEIPKKFKIIMLDAEECELFGG